MHGNRLNDQKKLHSLILWLRWETVAGKTHPLILEHIRIARLNIDPREDQFSVIGALDAQCEWQHFSPEMIRGHNDWKKGRWDSGQMDRTQRTEQECNFPCQICSISCMSNLWHALILLPTYDITIPVGKSWHVDLNNHSPDRYGSREAFSHRSIHRDCMRSSSAISLSLDIILLNDIIYSNVVCRMDSLLPPPLIQWSSILFHNKYNLPTLSWRWCLEKRGRKAHTSYLNNTTAAAAASLHHKNFSSECQQTVRRGRMIQIHSFIAGSQRGEAERGGGRKGRKKKGLMRRQSRLPCMHAVSS